MFEKITERIGFWFLNGFKPKEKEEIEFKNYFLVVKPKNIGGKPNGIR